MTTPLLARDDQLLQEPPLLGPPPSPSSDADFGSVVRADDPCEAKNGGAGACVPNKYLHARYYSPQLGIFLSPDPIGVAGGMNAYGYASGDPVNLADRSGLDPSICIGNSYFPGPGFPAPGGPGGGVPGGGGSSITISPGGPGLGEWIDDFHRQLVCGFGLFCDPFASPGPPSPPVPGWETHTPANGPSVPPPWVNVPQNPGGPPSGVPTGGGGTAGAPTVPPGGPPPPGPPPPGPSPPGPPPAAEPIPYIYNDQEGNVHVFQPGEPICQPYWDNFRENHEQAMAVLEYPLVKAGKWGAEVYLAGTHALPAFHQYIMGAGVRHLGLSVAIFGGHLAVSAAAVYGTAWAAVALPSLATAGADTLGCSPP